MRPLEEWDEDYIDNEIQPADETAWLEKKASAKFNLKSDGRPDSGTKDELAKQVSAFSNSGQGFLVYGIDDDNKLDVGVPTRIGNQSVKDWVEATIPTLVYPSATQCEAKLVRLPLHAANRGILVVSIPLSESRPHWITIGKVDEAYIRSGAHSERMRLQTVLDMASRGTTSQVEITSLGLMGDTPRPAEAGNRYKINPTVRLVAGPVCQLWSFELNVISGSGSFALPSQHATQNDKNHIYITGSVPLFPQRETKVSTNTFYLTVNPSTDKLRILATLYAGAAQPVRKEFSP